MTSWVELGGFKSVPSLGITRGKLKLAGYVCLCPVNCMH
jgi:hypothetical protein